MLTSKQANIYKKGIATIDDYLENVVCLICKMDGEQMSLNEAVQLPNV